MIWLPLALFLGFVVLFAMQLRNPAEREVESAMIGKPLPQFALRAAADVPGLANTDMADGKARLLNIWASWCVPCAAEAPQLEALRKQGVEIVGVAIRDRPDDVAQFLARYGNPYSRIGADDRSTVQMGIGSSGIPETFVVDGKGVIRYQHIGDIRAEHVPMLIEKLKEASK
ncbi:DsbE family thiol:disulfide interchange protein [Caenibius sp. WL]|uniref:DsbE family thiol:disulfide interchange protein n=1 Tax=Caenibius sp. WL TaxID=2872646 RepID=UPI001C992984|nr:DsbE family thiol:disulfide interchange protein [Caenibius sp. WL]